MQKKYEIKIIAAMGLTAYILLIAEIIAIIFITNSPLDLVIRGKWALIARALTVILGATYGTLLLQSSIHIANHRFPSITKLNYIIITATSFVFPWLQLYGMLRNSLSVTGIASCIKEGKYYASVVQIDNHKEMLLATNVGDVFVTFFTNELYLFMLLDDDFPDTTVLPPESIWKVETSQDGIHQALVCRLSIHSGVTELEAAQKITKAVDDLMM